MIKKNINSIFNGINISDNLGFDNEFMSYYKLLSNEKPFDSLINFFEFLQSRIEIVNEKVLDIGCGFGIHSIILSGYNNDVIGIDAADHRITEGQKFLSLINRNLYKVNIIKGPAYPLPFDNNTFDLVYCNEFVSHVYGLHNMLKESYRVLKDNGRILVLDCDRRNLFSLKQLYFDLPKMYDNFFLERRKDLLKKAGELYKIDLSDNWINIIAKKTEGWYKLELTELVRQYGNGIKNTDSLLSIYKPKFKYRCPDTGQYEERLFTRREMLKIVKECGFKAQIIRLSDIPLLPLKFIKFLIYKLYGINDIKYLVVGNKVNKT
ncbi:MAG: methyltransferase domain-containing protein [Candidatus Latescibacteria bacterium]|nr:methyltransferase domain-containing protein [Candidatus Latescibacterota bacterium]